MASLYSTKQFRRKNTRIAAEICPRLTIEDLDRVGLLKSEQTRSYAYMLVEDRIEMMVNANVLPDPPMINVQFQLKGGADKGWLKVLLSPTRSSRAQFPYLFICPGKRADDGKFSGCGKLVSVLYIPDYPGMCFLACRSCHGLTFLSRQVRHKSKKRHRPRTTLGFPPFTPPGSSHDALENPSLPAN